MSAHPAHGQSYRTETKDILYEPFNCSAHTDVIPLSTECLARLRNLMSKHFKTARA